MLKRQAKAKYRINLKSFRLSGARRFAIVACLMPLTATAAGADENAGDCLGIAFEVAHPVTIAKIIADRPQVHFVKNASDDAACPAEREGCAQPSYLIPGDLLLVGKTRGAYSCVSYQSAADRTQRWTVGWLPSASLTPVQPARAPEAGDWIGRWIHAGGAITITVGNERSSFSFSRRSAVSRCHASRTPVSAAFSSEYQRSTSCSAAVRAAAAFCAIALSGSPRASP